MSSLPYAITRDTILQAKKRVRSISFCTPFYFRLKYRLLCLGAALAFSPFVPNGYVALLLFFSVDYLLYRAHRNFISKQQLDYLEQFLKTESIIQHYMEDAGHTIHSENLSGEWLAYNLIRKKKLDKFIHGRNFLTAKLLDVGCSGGWLTESYKDLPNYQLLFGVDLSLPGLRIYKQAHPDISPPVLGDVESLPFKENTFDVIFATDVIEHLFHPDLFLREVKRILKPAGVFYLSTNNAHYVPFSSLINPAIVLEKTIGLYFPVVLCMRNLVYGDEGRQRYYHSDFERKDLLRLLADAGFSVQKMATFNFYWDVFAPLGEKIKNKLPLKIYLLVDGLFEMLPVLKYTGEHWCVEVRTMEPVIGELGSKGVVY